MPVFQAIHIDVPFGPTAEPSMLRFSTGRVSERGHLFIIYESVEGRRKTKRRGVARRLSFIIDQVDCILAFLDLAGRPSLRLFTHAPVSPSRSISHAPLVYVDWYRTVSIATTDPHFVPDSDPRILYKKSPDCIILII